jgi:hypothetical protein
MKTTYTYLFLMFAMISYAQTYIKGTILDENKEGIYYANIVIIDTGIGALSKSDGSFSLTVSDSLLLDTLEVSYLGYESKIFVINTLLDKPNMIELEKAENLLNEVVVIAKNAVIIEKGNKDKKSASGIGRTYYNWENVFIVAKFIDNDKNEKGFILAVSFFLNKSFHLKYGHQTPFRIRLYDVGEAGNPKEDLLLDNLIVQAQKKNKWHIVDISKYNIPIPKNGFFVGMEWLISEDEKYKKEIEVNYVKKDGTKKKRKQMVFGQGLGLVKREDLIPTEAKTWIAHGYSWQQSFCLRNREETKPFICHEAMIKTELEIYD